MEKFKVFLSKIAPITDQEYEYIVSNFSFQKLNKGESFIQQDRICNKIAFVLKGTLRTFYINEKFEEVTSCFCSESNMATSYKSFILQEPSKLTLQAIESTELLVINVESMQKLYNSSIIWQTIGRKLVEREYIIMEKYATVLNNESAKEKYLRLLKEQPNVVNISCVKDIASYLGVTRRTLSRIRREITMQ